MRKQLLLLLFSLFAVVGYARTVTGVHGHILPTLGGDDVHMIEVRPKRLFDIADLFGDLTLAARRMIKKETVHVFIRPVFLSFGNLLRSDAPTQDIAPLQRERTFERIVLLHMLCIFAAFA